jgi:hypothetical protein
MLHDGAVGKRGLAAKMLYVLLRDEGGKRPVSCAGIRLDARRGQLCERDQPRREDADADDRFDEREAARVRHEGPPCNARAATDRMKSGKSC